VSPDHIIERKIGAIPIGILMDTNDFVHQASCGLVPAYPGTAFPELARHIHVSKLPSGVACNC
jgi:hypothetical protein